MIYACDNCYFLFSRSGAPEQCPDCGKYVIRPATEGEQKEFAIRLKQPERWDGDTGGDGS